MNFLRLHFFSFTFYVSFIIIIICSITHTRRTYDLFITRTHKRTCTTTYFERNIRNVLLHDEVTNLWSFLLIMMNLGCAKYLILSYTHRKSLSLKKKKTTPTTIHRFKTSNRASCAHSALACPHGPSEDVGANYRGARIVCHNGMRMDILLCGFCVTFFCKSVTTQGGKEQT